MPDINTKQLKENYPVMFELDKFLKPNHAAKAFPILHS